MTRIERRTIGIRGLTAAGLATALLVSAVTAGTAPSPFSFRWHPETEVNGSAVVEVVGVDVAALHQLRQATWSTIQWQELLSVYADQGDIRTDVSMPPMLGVYRVGNEAIQFEPRFSWEPGTQYRAVFRPARLPDSIDRTRDTVGSVFRVQARLAGPGTVVSRVYPSSEVLPENLLKFYIHFSAPMSRGHIYRHIHLRNESGRDVELPFLEIDEELWNPAMTRLTLIIDPGRIKRGVRPLEEIGPALEAGKHFTLFIDRDWPDSSGQLLKEAFQKTFQVGPPDRDPLDPARWELRPPSPASRDPLTLSCPKPLDHALGQRLIQVIDATGRVVPGSVALEDHERKWTFSPESPWRSGEYQLVIDTTIEDLAGNNIGKSFDVDLFERVDRQFTRAAVKIPFQVR